MASMGEIVDHDGGSNAKKPVDWGKYGLLTGDDVSNPQPSLSEDAPLYPSGATGQNELFAEDLGANAKPWWKSNFFVSEPVLFGTWDGVFTSCLINIFGVIVFLRSGWLVGEAGIGYSVQIILVALLIILAAVFAGIGICERCPMDRGGVYYLISHVLGARIGGAIGLLYCFGQAVGGAIHIIGFGESIGRMLHFDNVWVERAFAICMLIVLVGINMAGVVWVIKLQFILLITLLLGGLDFTVGSFVSTNPEEGVEGYYSYNFWNNSRPAYTENNDWFTVFGVFFPTLTGVFAGINMSGDLRNPTEDIPTGTLSALGVSTFLYLTFVLILGSTCRRDVLLTDYLIAEKVSAIGVMFLAGLYVSSVSTVLATLYGTPRVLQCIAMENSLPFLHFLGYGRGPNKVPVIGILVTAMLTLLFVLIGQINTLAPVVTMPFMLTYAAIEYAYFALAKTYDSWQLQEQRLRDQNLPSPSFDSSKKASSYGATQDPADLDKLFPERNKMKPKMQRQLSSQTSSLVSSPDEHSSILSAESKLSSLGHKDPVDEGSVESLTDLSKLLPKGNASRHSEISRKTRNWYSIFCNRWVSLLGAFTNILIMFLVHWAYALANILAAIIIYIYIGQANPGVTPGVAEFKLFPWIKNSILKLFGRSTAENDQIVVTPMHPGIQVLAAQLTEDNEDFASRERYHQSSLVNGSKFDD